MDNKNQILDVSLVGNPDVSTAIIQVSVFIPFFNIQIQYEINSMNKQLWSLIYITLF